MIKIAICDDEEKERNRTMGMCNNYQLEHPEYDIRTTSFALSQELMRCVIQEEQFDIVLLDIYMPELSGMELARAIRENNEKCQIIFLTTSEAHAIEAFSIHATHYLVKPYSRMQLEDALSKAMLAVDKHRKAHLTLKVSGGVQKINYKDFIYSETEKHIQKLHLNDHKILQFRITGMELYELLSYDNRFFKCGSTYIINLEKVEEITTRFILFENGEKIPMQRRQYKELLELYTRYSVEGL